MKKFSLATISLSKSNVKVWKFIESKDGSARNQRELKCMRYENYYLSRTQKCAPHMFKPFKLLTWLSHMPESIIMADVCPRSIKSRLSIWQPAFVYIQDVSMCPNANVLWCVVFDMPYSFRRCHVIVGTMTRTSGNQTRARYDHLPLVLFINPANTKQFWVCTLYVLAMIIWLVLLLVSVFKCIDNDASIYN